jgi:hypothetical protein
MTSWANWTSTWGTKKKAWIESTDNPMRKEVRDFMNKFKSK